MKAILILSLSIYSISIQGQSTIPNYNSDYLNFQYEVINYTLHECGSAATASSVENLKVKLKHLESQKKYKEILKITIPFTLDNSEYNHFSDSSGQIFYIKYFIKAVKHLYPNYKKEITKIDYFDHLSFYDKEIYPNEIIFKIWGIKISIYGGGNPLVKMNELYLNKNNKKNVNLIFGKYFKRSIFYKTLILEVNEIQ